MSTLNKTGRTGKLVRSLFVFLMIPPLSLTLLLAQAAPSNSNSQNVQARSSKGKSDYAIANQQAVLSRVGNAEATRAVAHEAFRNIGVPVEIADAFGYTDRIVQAETAYRSGTHTPLHEQDVVTAVNNFATTLGTPAWTHTTPTEVRKLRVRLFLSIPQLFANHEPPDAKGHRALFSSDMGPLEAGFIATTMLYMKTFYPEYQFSDSERAQFQGKGKAAFATEQSRRTQILLDIVQGRSTSVGVLDLVPAADHLFQDLGMPSPAASALKMSPAPANQAASKGGL